MWLSERKKNPAGTDGSAHVGRVTLPGNPAGVYMAGERRDLPLFGPWGYYWCPAEDQSVLVVKTGAEGEQSCVAGARMDDTGISPGDICIQTGSASIRLTRSGSILLTGYVYANGTLISEP